MRRRIWTRLRAWLNNPVLTDSARTALAAMASLLAARLFALPEAYWAPITTLVVMQSALGTSLPIAGRQFAGAALGAGLSPVLAISTGPRALVLGVGIFLLGLLCAALGRIHARLRSQLDRTAYRYAGTTLAIIILIQHPEPISVIAVHRFLEVSTGIAVALVMTVVWPERPANTSGRP
jgi:uncharacterized membrane protein YccC